MAQDDISTQAQEFPSVPFESLCGAMEAFGVSLEQATRAMHELLTSAEFQQALDKIFNDVFPPYDRFVLQEMERRGYSVPDWVSRAEWYQHQTEGSGNGRVMR